MGEYATYRGNRVKIGHELALILALRERAMKDGSGYFTAIADRVEAGYALTAEDIDVRSSFALSS